MKASFYSGTSGLVAQQQAMDIIGNNLANINTNGYQSQGVSFNSLLSNRMYVNSTTEPLSGNGVKSVSTGLRLGSGTFRNTGENLDFAIAGNGFFAVEKDGVVQYTRDGSFSLSADGEEATLVTADGWYVLSGGGDQIELERVENETENGNNDDEYQDFDYAKLKEQIGIYTFTHPSALDPASASRYSATELSGEATEMGEEESLKFIRQGFVETSGTSVADEMANMIEAQRAFQLSARVVQTADEVEQTINNLRK